MSAASPALLVVIGLVWAIWLGWLLVRGWRRVMAAIQERIEHHSRTEAALVAIDTRAGRFPTPAPSALDQFRQQAQEHQPDDMGLLVSSLKSNEIVFSDGTIEKILGLEEGQFLGTAWRQLIDPVDLRKMAADTARHNSHGTYRYRRADGSGWVPVYFSWFFDPEIGAGACYLREATLEVASEQALQARRTIDSWRIRPVKK